MTYKRIILKKYGGPGELQLIEEPELPEPGKNEVRVKVLATSVNFTDIMIRKGMYPEVKQKPPFSPGYDMVGIIDKVGEHVKQFREGDKVADMTVIGSYSEYICLSENQLIPLPEELNPVEAVSLILSYVTAYQLLHREAKVKPGQKILVHGAGGAVGQAMLELGKLSGLEMYGTASASKHNIVSKHGATPIDYKEKDFAKQLNDKRIGGFDVVFDPIGGKNFKKSFGLLKKGGKLVAYGFYNAVMGHGGSIPADFIKLQLWNILPNGRKAGFYSIGALRKKHPEWFREDLTTLFDMLKDKKIKPLIGDKLPLSKAAEAQKMLENREVQGKIILKFNQ